MRSRFFVWYVASAYFVFNLRDFNLQSYPEVGKVPSHNHVTYHSIIDTN